MGRIRFTRQGPRLQCYNALRLIGRHNASLMT
jgi:hypothetical protein